MIRLIYILAVVLVGSSAFGQGFRGNPFTTNTFGQVTVVTNWSDFTNAVQRGGFGSWVVVPPNGVVVPGLRSDSGVMHIPTNQLSLLRPGVNIDCHPLLVIGAFTDFTPRPIFSETTGGSTNHFIFRNGLIVSNQKSDVITFTNAATRVTIEAPGAPIWRAGTNLNYTTIKLGGGTFRAKGGKLRNDGYDTWWNTGAYVTNYMEWDEVEAADTIVEEDGEGLAVLGESVVKIGVARRLNLPHLAPAQSLAFSHGGGRSWITIDTLDLGTNGTATFGFGGTGPGGCFIKHIKSSYPGNVSPPVSVLLHGRLVGTLITATNPACTVAPVSVGGYSDNGYAGTLENCTILASAAATASLFSASGDDPFNVVGTLILNKPVGSGVHPLGGLVAVTNQYAARVISALQEGSQALSNLVNNTYTNISVYSSSAAGVPLKVTGPASGTSNLLQLIHPGGAIVGRVETNGLWLVGSDVIFTNTTTDGTALTMGTLTLPDQSMVRCELVVNATMALGGTNLLSNIASYKRSLAFVCTNNTVTAVGSVTSTEGIFEHNAAWDATLDASGQTVRVRVTGVAATTIKWWAYLKMYPFVFP